MEYQQIKLSESDDIVSIPSAVTLEMSPHSSSDLPKSDALSSAESDSGNFDLDAVTDLQSNASTTIVQENNKQMLNEVFINWLHNSLVCSVQTIGSESNADTSAAPHISIDVSYQKT